MRIPQSCLISQDLVTNQISTSAYSNANKYFRTNKCQTVIFMKLQLSKVTYRPKLFYILGTFLADCICFAMGQRQTHGEDWNVRYNIWV